MGTSMIDLKRAKPKKGDTRANIAPAAVDGGSEERPYNLRFTLEGPELEKLGLTPDSFAGMEPIQATVLLDPINIRDIKSKGGDLYDKNRNQSVEFQVMKIAFGEMAKAKPKKFDAFNDQQKKGPGE